MGPVDLEAFTIAAHCRVDELLGELQADPDWRRGRTRAPASTLADRAGAARGGAECPRLAHRHQPSRNEPWLDRGNGRRGRLRRGAQGR
jgi:hypothetical protein